MALIKEGNKPPLLAQVVESPVTEPQQFAQSAKKANLPPYRYWRQAPPPNLYLIISTA
ncbi:hypothetical protein [Yersinia kristensenii]|uniref:hypothetical protein n=1 Tax=Yersinia kristensenii TaxID=28152 RepID=UPI000E05A146|nr:hypothetical protein [Yersinia kristensenii]SUP67010.1 Uncharacterised protein [Yersinia kristensenii]